MSLPGNCTKCGRPGEGRKFCRACGHPVEQPAVAVVEEPVPQRQLRRPGQGQPPPAPAPVETPVTQVGSERAPGWVDCPDGHPNPPERVRCRVCGELVRPTSPPVERVAEPARAGTPWLWPTVLTVGFLALLVAVWFFL